MARFGMAYGVISSTTLLAFGVSPAHASAAVHAAELFTTAASGSAHLYHRNIDWKLFRRLAPFGILGGCLGAYVLTSFDGNVIKPFITTYLALVGVWLLVRSFRRIPSRPVPAGIVAPLGAAGGFLDAAGGGGWGPIVTTGLLGAGGSPRYVIGTVNASEFLITLSVSLTFLFAMLTGHWECRRAHRQSHRRLRTDRRRSLRRAAGGSDGQDAEGNVPASPGGLPDRAAGRMADRPAPAVSGCAYSRSGDFDLVNADQVKRVAKQVKGSIKDSAGKAIGNEQMQAEGKAGKVAGKIQKGFGDVREKIKRAL